MLRCQRRGAERTSRQMNGQVSQHLVHGIAGRSLCALVVAVAALIQGCALEVPRHVVGNWQSQGNYVEAFSYTVPGRYIPVLNSCSEQTITAELQCSSHGHCAPWFESDSATGAIPKGPLFCRCDRDWTDPECGTQRKSQTTAYVLSLFFGWLGADQFYLGFAGLAVAKLLTVGGLGTWWIFDVVRIGSSPVVTTDSYRVAHDVEHWAFALSFVAFCCAVGFILSLWSINRERVRKAREILILEADAAQGYGSTKPWDFQSGEMHFTTAAPTASNVTFR